MSNQAVSAPRPFDLAAFVDSYIEAIYFTDTGDTDQPDSDITMHAECVTRCQDECAAFLWKVYPFLDHIARTTDQRPEAVYNAAARDFWYTRNGHGVGFWEDSRWPVSGDILDRAAQGFTSVDVYETDSGELDMM